MTDTVQTVAEAEIKKFDITEAAIETMKAEFLPLEIAGVEDREGYKKVHDARMFVQKKRIAVEKRRVELKKPFLDASVSIDTEAKRITKLLTPIEEDLEAKEKAIDDEKERIKEEERKKEEARIKARFDKLQTVGAYLDLGVLTQMTDEGFEGYYEARKADYEKAVAERERIQREAEAKQTAAHLEDVRKRKEAEEENARVRAENLRIVQENRKKAEELAAKEAELKAKEAALKQAEKKAEENEPTPIPIRPVTPAVSFTLAPVETVTLSKILTALSSAAYHNHQRALVDDPNFTALRKMAKGVLPVIL